MNRRIKIILARRYRHQQGALDPRMWFPGMFCAICGSTVHQWQMFNFDHTIPMGNGGAKGRRNKEFAHVICNTVKGDQHPFSLRSAAERAAIRCRVRPAVYDRLLAAWHGE